MNVYLTVTLANARPRSKVKSAVAIQHIGSCTAVLVLVEQTETTFLRVNFLVI